MTHLTCSEEKGATMVEYALLVALIAIVCLAALQMFGFKVSDKFAWILEKLGEAW